MTADYYPLQVLLMTVSGWVNREQLRTIEYLIEENRVLKEQFKGRKLRLNDNQVIDRAVRIGPSTTTEIHVHERLGGLRRYYRTAA